MQLLYFTAKWCAACHAIEHLVPDFAQRIDCDKDQKTPALYNVSALPMFIAINDEKEEVGRISSTNVPMVVRWYKEICKE
jgi:thiol-disulfide isomerase/thioredoxin